MHFCLFHLTIVAAWVTTVHAFHLLVPEQRATSLATTVLWARAKKAKTPEYIIEDEHSKGGDEALTSRAPKRSDGKPSEIRLTAPKPVQEDIQQNSPPSNQEPQKSNLQYAALPPGTVVQIQVGDMGLARKAWKKRRRSGSPLLVPCSVLNVDRASTVRWNLIYLLEKFGRGAGSKGGIRLSLADLAKRSRSHLKTSLAKQATALGFDDPKALVQALFNERVQKSYGIDLIEDENGELFLQAPVSRLRAQKRANRSPVLQISDDFCEDTLKHTGVVRIRREEKSEEGENLYKFRPLSAALRVNQKEDVDAGNIQSGSMHTAVVFDYDAAGDAGSPLITLSLNSAPRERLRFGNDGNQHRDTIRNPKHMLNDLKSGDGPIQGKVVRFIKGGALIDCSIGRRVGSRPEAETVRVLGLLKFDDAVIEEAGKVTQVGWSDENDQANPDDEDESWEDILSFGDLESDHDEDDDEVDLDLSEIKEESDLATLFNFDDAEEGEEVEDITHMFKTEEDGSLTYTDPETGEVRHISMDSLDESEDDDENEDDDLLDVFSTMESDDIDDDDDDGPILLKKPVSNKQSLSSGVKLRSKRLYLGDEVEVYVRSIAKQSNQLFFTMKASVKGKKPKEIKQELGKEKKMSRLLKQVGGTRRLQELDGLEMDGIVKATSHTGDWYYVQPQEADLPVGIAFRDSDSLVELNQGDKVRIKLDGVDETRGQLSMRVLGKVAP